MLQECGQLTRVHTTQPGRERWRGCCEREYWGRETLCRPRVVMMPTLSSLAAPRVVFMTTCGATSDDRVGIT